MPVETECRAGRHVYKCGFNSDFQTRVVRKRVKLFEQNVSKVEIISNKPYIL